MTNREAMEMVLEMAHKSYSKNFGPTEKESEAIWQIEDYMNDLMRWDEKADGTKPPTGCDYGIGG